MTLDEAMKLADQDCPLPALGGKALRVLRDRVRELEDAAPCRTVDIGAIRAIADDIRNCGGENSAYNAERLTRALSGEKAGPVGDGVYPVAIAPKDAPSHSIELLVYLPEHGWRRGFYTGFYAEQGKWPWSAEPFPSRTNRTITHWAHLPASPTPDKEG